MASTNIILEDVKKQVGLIPEYDAFDDQLLMDINAAFATLHQLGVGPADGFTIEDEYTEWTDFVNDDAQLQAVKSYMYLKVKLRFDPPLSTAVIESTNRMIAELEWRLNVAAESEE